MMKTKYLAAVLWAAAIYIGVCALSGCTTTGEPDWSVIQREAYLVADDARDAALLVDGVDVGGAPLDVVLVALANNLDLVANSMDDGLPDDLLTVRGLIDATLLMTAETLDALPSDQDDARAIIILSRIALRRVRAVLPGGDVATTESD